MRMACLALILVGTGAEAQELARVAVLQEVTVLMSATVEPGDQLNGVTGFALDADLDGDQDLIVEVGSSPIGGNAYWTVPYILRNTGAGFEIAAQLELNGLIRSVRLAEGIVTITTATYRDNDPRCCPSGTEVKSFALR